MKGEERVLSLDGEEIERTQRKIIGLGVLFIVVGAAAFLVGYFFALLFALSIGVGAGFGSEPSAEWTEYIHFETGSACLNGALFCLAGILAFVAGKTKRIGIRRRAGILAVFLFSAVALILSAEIIFFFCAFSVVWSWDYMWVGALVLAAAISVAATAVVKKLYVSARKARIETSDGENSVK